MVERTKIRKDKSAQETINKIKEILSCLDIEVDEKIQINNGDNIFSCRVAIKGTDFGSNGKGISEEYALASAYAEFMERMQARYLFINKDSKNGIIRGKKRGEGSLTLEEIYNFGNEYFSSELNDIYNEKMKNVELSNASEYFCHINTGKMVPMYLDLIDIMCGSNGLCAGNTLYEAVAQGIGEIFERMVYKHVIMENLECPTIPVDIYKDTYSMKMIKFLNEKKYKVLVKDFSLGGKYPVLGIVLISPAKTKIKLSVASDINFDIALQRCLTEALQGRKLDGFFPTEMKSLFPLEKLTKEGNIADNYISSEILKTFVNGSGIVPLSLFINNQKFCVDNLNVFHNNNLSNKEAYEYLLSIIQKNNLDLYVKNYSTFGFPTYRVFIKNESSIHIGFEKTIYKCWLRKSLLKKDLNKENIEEIMEILFQLNNMLEAPREQEDLLAEFLIKNNLEEITNDSRYIEVLLLLYRKDYRTAYMRYNDLFKQEERELYIIAYLFELQNGEEDSLKQFWKQLEDERALIQIEKIEKHLKILIFEIELNEKREQTENVWAGKLMEKIEKELIKLNGWNEDYQRLRLIKES